jgi:DNA-binding Lrp family transcriptional regulator
VHHGELRLSPHRAWRKPPVRLSISRHPRCIKRMTEEGVIRANVAIIDPAAVGQTITIFV